MSTVLRMTQVTKTYGSGDAAVHALDGVDFNIEAGEVVVVMGPSGAGKTTFLTIAGALLTPTSGSVEISGVNITALSEKELPDVRRERIGFVFQSFNLLEALSAIENVTLVMLDGSPKSRGAVNRARELMSMLGLGHRLKSLPKQLSGGKKQRVAIARALANNPDLILADEPTANLDSKRGREVMQLCGRSHLRCKKLSSSSPTTTARARSQVVSHGWRTAPFGPMSRRTAIQPVSAWSRSRARLRSVMRAALTTSAQLSASRCSRQAPTSSWPAGISSTLRPVLS